MLCAQCKLLPSKKQFNCIVCGEYFCSESCQTLHGAPLVSYDEHDDENDAFMVSMDT